MRFFNWPLICYAPQPEAKRYPSQKGDHDVKRIDCESNRMAEAFTSGQLAPPFRTIPAALLSFLLFAPGLAAGGNEPAPKPASAQPTVLKVHYGDESYTWFVPAELLGDFLASNPPQGDSEGLRFILERSCDFQGLSPNDSKLCFREPRPVETEAETWERTRKRLAARGLPPAEERKFLDHLERRIKEREEQGLRAGVQTNSCDGSGSPPLASLVPAHSPLDAAASSAVVLIGQIQAVTPGWSATAGLLATAVTVRVRSVHKQPQGVEIKDEVTFLERRAYFEVDRLRICSGLEVGPNSQVGMTVLIASNSWSTNGDQLHSAFVYEVLDGHLSRELVLGGDVREEPTVDHIITALSEAR